MNIEPIQPIALNGAGIRSFTPPQDHRMMAHHHARPDATAKTKEDTQEVQKALDGLNQAIEPFNTSLKFSRDEETGKIVIQMIDDKSGTTLHQFPEEAMLKVAAILGKLQGKIFNQRA